MALFTVYQSGYVDDDYTNSSSPWYLNSAGRNPTAGDVIDVAYPVTVPQGVTFTCGELIGYNIVTMNNSSTLNVTKIAGPQIYVVGTEVTVNAVEIFASVNDAISLTTGASLSGCGTIHASGSGLYYVGMYAYQATILSWTGDVYADYDHGLELYQSVVNSWRGNVYGSNSYSYTHGVMATGSRIKSWHGDVVGGGTYYSCGLYWNPWSVADTVDAWFGDAFGGTYTGAFGARITGAGFVTWYGNAIASTYTGLSTSTDCAGVYNEGDILSWYGNIFGGAEYYSVGLCNNGAIWALSGACYGGTGNYSPGIYNGGGSNIYNAICDTVGGGGADAAGVINYGNIVSWYGTASGHPSLSYGGAGLYNYGTISGWYGDIVAKNTGTAGIYNSSVIDTGYGDVTSGNNNVGLYNNGDIRLWYGDALTTGYYNGFAGNPLTSNWYYCNQASGVPSPNSQESTDSLYSWRAIIFENKHVLYDILLNGGLISGDGNQTITGLNNLFGLDPAAVVVPANVLSGIPRYTGDSTPGTWVPPDVDTVLTSSTYGDPGSPITGHYVAPVDDKVLTTQTFGADAHAGHYAPPDPDKVLTTCTYGAASGTGNYVAPAEAVVKAAQPFGVNQFGTYDIQTEDPDGTYVFTEEALAEAIAPLTSAVTSLGLVDVTLVSPVDAAQTTLTLTHGDTYNVTTGQPLVFSAIGWPTLGSPTVVTLYVRNTKQNALISQVAQLVSGTGTQTMTFYLTSAQTHNLTPDPTGNLQSFEVVAVFSDGSQRTITNGTVIVRGAMRF